MPIAFNEEIEGAFGSRWVLKLSVVNRSGAPAYITGYTWPCQILCPPGWPVTPAEVTFQPSFNIPQNEIRYGHYIVVEKAIAGDVHFELRVRDLSRELETAGTEIPVVRESQFFTKSMSLLDVPVRADLRHVLRIYALDPAPAAAVRVRYYEQREQDQPFASGPSTDRLLHETVRTFRVQEGSVPGYIEISELDLEGKLPETTRKLRVDIDPGTDGLRYWAFVSVTHNATQHVTTITP